MWQRLASADAAWSARVRVAERPGALRTSAMILAHSGDSWFWLAGLGLVWWYSGAEWKFRALVLATAILGTAVVVQAMKFTIRRRRPEGDWGAIYRLTDPHSFPSGHAARAGLLLGSSLWLGPPWFALALMVWAPIMPLARVALGVHYILDIVAGFGLGLLAAAAVGLALSF